MSDLTQRLLARADLRTGTEGVTNRGLMREAAAELIALRGALDVHEQAASKDVLKLLDTVTALRAALAEANTLAGIGTWHADCRPNRHMAARELAKSQAVIDKLADRITELEKALADAQLRLNTEQQHRVEFGTVTRLTVALAEARAEIVALDNDNEWLKKGLALQEARADALQAERDLYRKKAHDWNAEADKYLARADEQTVRADAAERDYTECARGRIGDAEIIGRLMGEKDAAERALREALAEASQWRRINEQAQVAFNVTMDKLEQ